MYTPVGIDETIDWIEHIRALHRQRQLLGDRSRAAHQRREQKIKDFISNLRRSNMRPMANMVRDIEEACLLTTDGASRLFGYNLDGIREFDSYLNGGRTHILESRIFHRDLMVELPLKLASAESFRRSAMLDSLVLQWQGGFPLRVLDQPIWRRPGTFYVHVGTEDSLGSSLPPGATALVEPVDQGETLRPNPLNIYLLQFANGYSCSRCVVSGGKLQLLTSDRSYLGRQVFSYPLSVRIVGRIALFALPLPAPDFGLQRPISQFSGGANLILPWENSTRHELFATKHRRFIRPSEERRQVEELLRLTLHSKLSDRSRRRYRQQSDSEPHIASLIQMTIEHYARYGDALRLGGYRLRDAGRYSLETMLRATRYEDLRLLRSEPAPPIPAEVWEARRKEIVEWPALLSLKFPRPSAWSHRVLRIGDGDDIRGVEPPIRSGSWLLLEDLPTIPDSRSDAGKRGWSRPLYVLARGLELLFGHLERDGDEFALLRGPNSQSAPSVFSQRELGDLRRVCGVITPV